MEQTVKKIAFIFGTRPEAIKMAPLVKAVEKEAGLKPLVIVTAQHREMLDQVMALFELEADYDLNLMKAGQSLGDITTGALCGLEEVLKKERPDMVLVHGDTTTTFAGALASFYQGIKVGHVEAGLRSFDMSSPFPEEANRKLTGVLSSYHFAPTPSACDNLLREGIKPESILVTGNTVIDALMETANKPYTFTPELEAILSKPAKKILLTTHRRENQGEPMRQIFEGILDLVQADQEVYVIFPVHKNPKIRALAKEVLGEHPQILCIEPLDYLPFVHLISRVDLVLTDSGGLQEEAPSLGKPVLVLRDNTERPEAIEAGTVVLIGTDKVILKKSVSELLYHDDAYQKMAQAINPYGDGKASERIVQGIKYFLGLTEVPAQNWQ